MAYTQLAESFRNEDFVEVIREFILRGKYYTQNKAGAIGLVSKDDCTLVAAKILNSSSDEVQNRTLNVTGPAALTGEQVAQIISKRYLKNVTIVEVSEMRLIEEFMAVGYSADKAKIITNYDSSVVSGLWNRVGTAVKDIADKEPESFEDWLIRSNGTWLSLELP